MIEGLLAGYLLGKLLDTGGVVVKHVYTKWKTNKCLDEITSPIQKRDRSHQITPMIVPADGIDSKPNAVLKENAFPNPIRAVITELSFNELSELMKRGQVQRALAYAQRHINAIDAALMKDYDLGNRYAEELRSDRQRLLFAAASAASWQGDIGAGREFWWSARDLGAIDPEWHKQAAITLFNIGLKDELRRLVDHMDQESEVYRKIAAPCLAYLEEDWYKVEKLLAGAQSTDQLLHRVEARLQIIDSQNAETVKLTAELLEQTDGNTVLPVINLTRARLTVDLLMRVVREYTPLDYDRRPLIDNLVRRMDVALETTEPDSILHAQALGCLSVAASLLRDDELREEFNSRIEALPKNIRSSVFLAHDPALTLEKIDSLLAKGRITITQAAILKAEFYRTSGQPEQIERELYSGLCATPGKRERAAVLGLLVQHLRQENRTDEIHRLIETIPVRPADKWLLRTENFPIGKTPIDLVDEVKAFPMDVDVIEYLVQLTLSTVKFSSPEDAPPDQADLNRAELAVNWTTKLVEILPARSSRLLHAQALLAARRYKELLTISQDLDPVYAEQAAEFKAWSLIGLGQRVEGIDCFISASRTYPKSTHFVAHAARLLLIENQPKEAATLLEPHVTAGSEDPNVLFFYAQSLRAKEPSSQLKASRAFDLLGQAYVLRPDPKIAQGAWHAARAAGREAEARRFFEAMVAEIPVKVVETEDDFSRAIQEADENRGVLIEGGYEYLAKMVEEERKRSEFLGELHHVHSLSYVDFFQHSGRSWELWTYWTQQFEKRSYGGETSPGEFSVLVDWPFVRPIHDLQHDTEDTELFLDQTAILTLGVLGPKTAEQLLAALRRCYISTGTMEGLRRDLSRIQGQLLASPPIPYIEAAHFFRQRSDAVVTYSSEIEAKAPDDPDLGPWRVDLGVAIKYDALYVTDNEYSGCWTEEANQRRISSAVLLASLNEAGEVTADVAGDAAKKRPNAFGGWDTAKPQPIPETLVFNEHAILDWIGAGLANVLGNRVKVGPWAWMCISEESGRQEAMELARERLNDARRVLQVALDEGILVEIELNVNTGTLEETNDEPSEEASIIAEFWSGALKSLRTAQSNGLQLWADDRFYPLLLRYGGPRNMGAEVDTIREPFVDWAETMPPFSTIELLNQLSLVGRLSSTVAQDACAKLFSQGYRMAHPLILAHTLRQYPLPASGQITPPFLKLVHAITEIPRYFSGTFNSLYGNRDGLIRVTSMEVAKRLIVGVWKAEELSTDQRCTLSNAFLDAVEQVFEGVHPKGASFRADRTPISFWQGIAYSLQMMPITSNCPFERYFAALRWLGAAAASRVDQRSEILRVLEDNFLDSLKSALGAFEGTGEENSLRQIIATFIAPAFIPLTNASFNSILDPLLRRTVSMLARFTAGGRVTKNYYHNPNRDGTPLKISEEEDEKAAAEVLERIASGDSKYARLVWGIDLVFSYSHPAPVEWTDEGFPSDEGIGVDVRCSLFTLLWDGHPGLHENIVRLLVYRLSVIDPVLAYRIFLLEDDLLSDDSEKVQEAHDRLGVELLRSGYFDLQRSLVHAVQRLSQYDADAFSQFIGWIGEDASQALANHLTTPHVWQIGPLLVPTAHLLGRALLTYQFDDGHMVLELVEQLLNAGDDQDRQNPGVPKLTEWLEDKAHVAENAPDPFVAAWALRAVLLVFTKMNQDPELNVNGRVVKVSDWATNYITIALAPDVSQPSVTKQQMIDRRRLASAALLLASFICSGHKHREAYSQGEDPWATWLEHVWLMATKLQVGLVWLQGGVSDAAEAAAKAVNELELHTPDIPIVDAFNPFAFVPDGDDIGTALTLTAMFKAVRQLPDNNECPTWWTTTIRSLLENLASVGSDNILPTDGELDNRFGLAAPLHVRTIAQQLIMALAS